MLPPHRGVERPCRIAELDRATAAKAPEEPETNTFGRVILKPTLRVLEPAVRQAKLTIVK